MMASAFQEWINENEIVDVRFYPKNPTESAASQILDDAMKAIQSYELGNFVNYEDDTPEHCA